MAPVAFLALAGEVEAGLAGAELTAADTGSLLGGGGDDDRGLLLAVFRSSLVSTSVWAPGKAGRATSGTSRKVAEQRPFREASLVWSGPSVPSTGGSSQQQGPVHRPYGSTAAPGPNRRGMHAQQIAPPLPPRAHGRQHARPCAHLQAVELRSKLVLAAVKVGDPSCRRLDRGLQSRTEGRREGL